MPVVAEQFYALTYSDEVYASLCEDFNIPHQIRVDFREQLEDVAAIWRWKQSRAEIIRRPSEDVKALASVLKHVQKLSLALDALSPDALIALERINSRFETQAILSDATHSDAGHEFHRYTNHDGVEVILTDTAEDLIRAVSVLEHITVEAKESIRLTRAGSRSDYALSLWLTNIADMWTNQLGRPFTRDATTDGEPLTHAAQFCITTFTYISPSTSSTKIINGMKKHISKSRK